ERDVDAQQALLDQGLKAVERSAGLTKQLLAVGRQSKFVREQIHLPTFMQELEQFLLHIIPTSINLSVRGDGRIQSIESDASLLQSMLLNLAMNARDALSGGGDLEITLEVAEVEHAQRLSVGQLEPGTYARFSVRDNGRGIPSEIFGRVLEPFFTTRPVGEGTGLGLAMVAGFVQQVEGALNIASTPGEGTVVRIYLPLEDGWGYADVARDHACAEAMTDTPLPLKVLLVEDQPQLKELLTDHLTERGYEVRACSSGDDAYATVEAGYEADVLLTDVVMSGSMQGAELVSSLQARWPTACCILMSGYSFNQESFVKSPRPPDAVLTKPFRMQELDQLIESVTAR
ncbi:MAG: ATP-binding protein, partial [Pseudomonadota bacterium]